jgi:hypothetical protein
MPAEASRRSTLVTVLAWLAIAWSAWVTLLALGGVLLLAVTPRATLDAFVNGATQDSSLQMFPWPYQLMARHLQLAALGKAVWWAAILAVSIGVLRRKEWARRAFVAVLAIQSALVVIGIVVGQSVGMNLARRLAARSRSGQVPPGMGTGLALGALLGFGIVAILLSLLFTFRSRRVREEFEANRRAA